MDASEIGRTDHTGVIHELSDSKAWFWVKTPRRQVGKVRLAHGIQQKVTRDGDSPAEDKQFGIEDGAEACTSLAEPTA